MKQNGRTLLVVDDEPDLREILAFTFERKGYVVFQAENAIQAIEVVKKNKIDVIISDIRMPGGDGMQLLEEVKKYNPDIPMMLFVTGFADVTFEEAYDKGVDAIFSKPFDTKVLLAAVDKMLQNLEEKWAVRRAAREPSCFSVDLKFQNFEEARKAHVLNIGRGGFFIRMTENFPKLDQVIPFRMVFDEGILTIIEGDGKVKWIRPQQEGDLPPGCGIEFISLDTNARIKVFELINYLKTQQYIPKS